MAWFTGEDYEHKTSLSDFALLRRFSAFLLPHKKLLGVSLLLAPFEKLFPIGRALLLKQAIDHVLPQGQAQGMLWVMALFVLCVAGEFLFSYIGLMLNELVGQRVTAELRVNVFGHLLRQSHGFYDQNPIGKITTRVTNDIENLGNFFSMGAVSLLKDLLTLVYVIAAIFLLNAKLTLGLLPVLLGVYFLSDFFRRRLRHSSREIRDAMARINGFLQEHISGAHTVQLYGQRERTVAGFEGHNRDYLRAYLANIKDDALLFALIEWGETMVIALVMIFAAATATQQAITLGAMVTFATLIQQFFVPVRDLSQKFAVIQSALASLEKIFSVLDTDTEVKTPIPQALEKPVRGALALNNLWFAYQGENWVLKGISLSIPPGQRVALVGHTGSGKSTLFKLLLRFYEPTRGGLSLDGVGLDHMEPSALYDTLGMVSQDIEIFDGTLMENLTLLQSGMSREQVLAKLKSFDAEAVFPNLMERLDEPVQAGGRNFSQGEKQLLSILRAMLRDPPVVLLDEATASVDAATETRLQQAMERLFEGRTVLVIAHRLATVRSCHRVVVMHHGRVAEDGPHADLLEQNGLYTKLYQLQFSGGGVAV